MPVCPVALEFERTETVPGMVNYDDAWRPGMPDPLTIIEEVLDYRTFSCSKAIPYSKPNSDFLLKQEGKRKSKIDISSW